MGRSIVVRASYRTVVLALFVICSPKVLRLAGWSQERGVALVRHRSSVDRGEIRRRREQGRLSAPLGTGDRRQPAGPDVQRDRVRRGRPIAVAFPDGHGPDPATAAVGCQRSLRNPVGWSWF